MLNTPHVLLWRSKGFLRAGMFKFMMLINNVISSIIDIGSNLRTKATLRVLDNLVLLIKVKVFPHSLPITVLFLPLLKSLRITEQI